MKVSYTYTADNRTASITRTNLAGVGRTDPQVTTYSYTKYADGMLQTASVDGPLPGTGDKVTYTYGATRYLGAQLDTCQLQRPGPAGHDHRAKRR